MIPQSNTSKIYLVGAGPGNPDLITVKGLNVIKQAHVILYDALASPDLLKHADAACKLIYVGKRKSKCAFSQNEINQLLVFYAGRYACVVRLKGGDPFVFGRGHEEMEYAMKRGFEVELVPGISSALSGPAALGIPLTKRGVNESFWVVTGTLSDGSISNDLEHAAKSTATVIILMGLSQLDKIIDLFKNNRGENEPIAIVQNATLPTQKSVTGSLQNISALVRERGIESPAVIIIGNVVKENLQTKEYVNLLTESFMKIAV